MADPSTQFSTVPGGHQGDAPSWAASGRQLRQMPLIYVFFFFSGFPALLYQIVWQRALFTIYGINIESVTMVVSAFMLGLGLGSLLGGMVSAKRGIPLLLV